MSQNAALHDASVRIGYIRTTTHPEKNTQEMFTLLNDYMRQTSLSKQEAGEPRHRFLFGATNISDSHILNLVVQQISAKTQADIGTSAGDPFPGRYRHMMDTHTCRADFELHISETRAATVAGQTILKRCEDEDIMTRVSGATDADCDDYLLEASEYLIDFLTPDLHYDHPAWFRQYARTGEKQDNMLSNPQYDVGKHDASKTRLAMRYMGYGWRANSGCSHGNGEWRCGICGSMDGKCTRRKCVNGASEKRQKELKRAQEQHEEWVEWARLPSRGDKRWLEMTAEGLCRRFDMRKKVGEKEAARWKSVDTFSGD